MNRLATLLALGLVTVVLQQGRATADDSQVVSRDRPNVLWLLTDDQRYDSVRAFNKMLHGREMSELGYVESPNVDRLAKMGTTFINTYCQAQGCAPSRASLHYGRYPFRSGIYEFKYHNNNAEHCRPTLPETMAELGYQTTHVGKLGVRIKTIKGKWAAPHPIYQQSFYFKDLAKDGLCGWGKGWVSQIKDVKFDEPFRSLEFFMTPSGEFKYCSLELEKLMPEFAGTSIQTMKDYDLLRHYNEKKGKHVDSGMILAGVSSREAGKTRDGYYASIFVDFLKNEDRKFTVGSRQYDGVDTSKPLFCHIGFDFPHTPVLPPADDRERFQQHDYEIPTLDERELETMPAQLRKQVEVGFSDHFTKAEKLAMVQDYYAFCAYGDRLIGQAADAFIEYSESHQQPWAIVYVCGDHGWKLNDHGAVSKFTPWDVDSHNPIIVVSSDKAAFPAGKVVTAFTEFVDVAPTILAMGGAKLKEKQYEYLDGFNLRGVASGEIAPRDYVIGESHAVIGPRAFIRTKDYVFSMQTRPNRNRGENVEWARTATYEDLDPALYHMPTDPKEVRNLAFASEHQDVAQVMRKKLLEIVLGDNRIEVDWGDNRALGTKVFRSNFAPGSDDKKLKL
ncbi:MAG: sulfatase-like hydrolase/transferase [Planctomycetota bacterium]